MHPDRIASFWRLAYYFWCLRRWQTSVSRPSSSRWYWFSCLLGHNIISNFFIKTTFVFYHTTNNIFLLSLISTQLSSSIQISTKTKINRKKWLFFYLWVKIAQIMNGYIITINRVIIMIIITTPFDAAHPCSITL